jgi:hypothetical protein
MFDPLAHHRHRLRSNSNPHRPPPSDTSPKNVPIDDQHFLNAPPRPPRNPARPRIPPASADAQDHKPFWDLSPVSAGPKSSPAHDHQHSFDFSLLKRNKSTGSKMSRLRSNTQPAASPLDNANHARYQLAALESTRFPSPSPKIKEKVVVTHSHSRPRTMSATAFIPNQSLQEKKPPPFIPLPPPQPPPPPLTRKQEQLQFSTADKTILEELKRSISAHAAQFVMKGGHRHHPYPHDVVPYPRSYHREAVDLLVVCIP